MSRHSASRWRRADEGRRDHPPHLARGRAQAAGLAFEPAARQPWLHFHLERRDPCSAAARKARFSFFFATEQHPRAQTPSTTEFDARLDECMAVRCVCLRISHFHRLNIFKCSLPGTTQINLCVVQRSTDLRINGKRQIIFSFTLGSFENFNFVHFSW